MTPQALTKIIADVAPDAATQAFIDLHMALAQGEFRNSFKRQSAADLLRKLGSDDGAADAFEAAAERANDAAEKHLRLAMDAQRGVVL